MEGWAEMKAFLAEGSVREELVVGMELESMILGYIKKPDYQTFEDITKGMMNYNELWSNNHLTKG